MPGMKHTIQTYCLYTAFQMSDLLFWDGEIPFAKCFGKLSEIILIGNKFNLAFLLQSKAETMIVGIKFSAALPLEWL